MPRPKIRAIEKLLTKLQQFLQKVPLFIEQTIVHLFNPTPHGGTKRPPIFYLFLCPHIYSFANMHSIVCSINNETFCRNCYNSINFELIVLNLFCVYNLQLILHFALKKYKKKQKFKLAKNAFENFEIFRK